MVVIELPWPPSANHLHTVARGRKILSAKGRAYRWAVALACSTAKAPKLGDKRLSVQIDAFAPDRRRRDLDNPLKAALDGLTSAGLWDDDSQIDHISIRRMPTLAGMLRVKVAEVEITKGSP